MKLLSLTISEISEENKQQRQENKLLREENQLLRQEKRNNNTKVKSLHNETVEQERSPISVPTTKTDAVELQGTNENLSASELTDVLNNPSQMIEESFTQEIPSKKKKYKTVYSRQTRRDSANKSTNAKKGTSTKEEVSIIQSKKEEPPILNKLLVPETVQFQHTPSLLERAKPRIPDTPEKKGGEGQEDSKLEQLMERNKQQEQVKTDERKIRVWEKDDKKEEEIAASQMIESSSGEPDIIEEDRASPVFYRSKFGSGNPERLKKMSGKRKSKKSVVEGVVEIDNENLNAGDTKKQTRKSNNSSVTNASNVGTVTPKEQSKVDRKTWQNLDKDFRTRNSDGIGCTESMLVDESPNLLQVNRIPIPRDILDEIPKPNIAESSAPAEKENFKPKSKPKSKKEAENRWGMTVEPITESQKKKIKTARQSTLDMFYKNPQDGSGIKRTMSDLERAIQISKQEFSAGDKSADKPAPEPPVKKTVDHLDDTMEMLALREREREELHAYKPPPLTPPDFWEVDIVEPDADDPRNKTQQGPPLRTRAIRLKERRKQNLEQQNVNYRETTSKPTVNGVTGKLKRKRTETAESSCTNGRVVKASNGRNPSDSEDEFY